MTLRTLPMPADAVLRVLAGTKTINLWRQKHSIGWYLLRIQGEVVAKVFVIPLPVPPIEMRNLTDLEKNYLMAADGWVGQEQGHLERMGRMFPGIDWDVKLYLHSLSGVTRWKGKGPFADPFADFLEVLR